MQGRGVSSERLYISDIRMILWIFLGTLSVVILILLSFSISSPRVFGPRSVPRPPKVRRNVAYLAVDADGSCHIFDRKIKRFFEDPKDLIISIKDAETPNIWIPDFVGQEVPNLGLRSHKIEISNASMVKLAGRVLTWSDEPLEI